MRKKYQKPNITIIGSSNTDMTIRSNRLPVPGETIIGKEFLMTNGGKGANQSVAAVRLGGEVTFISKLGDDLFGEKARSSYKEEGIITDFISIDDDHPSGVALIMVDREGENCISVAGGANQTLCRKDVDKAKAKIKTSDIILMQLEIPLSVVEYVTSIADKKQKIILNPAPAQPLSESILQQVYLLTPNISEAEILSGVSITDMESMEKAASILKSQGAPNIIITLGARGAYVSTKNEAKMIPAPVVEAIDTTAAGDTFNGALAVAIGQGKGMEEAVSFAIQAASLSVTRLGAQSSIPFLEDINLLPNKVSEK